MFEEVALFRREELSAQKPRGSRELKESARLPNLGLQGPILHHAKTPRPGTSIQISARSLCRSLCLFSPMQDLGFHCVLSSFPLTEQRKGWGVTKCNAVFFLPFLSKKSWDERKQKDYCSQESCTGTGLFAPLPYFHRRWRVLHASAWFPAGLLFTGRWEKGGSIHSEGFLPLLSSTARGLYIPCHVRVASATGEGSHDQGELPEVASSLLKCMLQTE